MGYVKSQDEIARIQHALHAPRFVNAQMLSVDFLTEPATLDRILPPGFSQGDEPLVTAMIGRWQSNCVGDFYGGAIYIAARFGDLAGGYVLAMYMDNDTPTIYGRDLFGEPKKIAHSNVFRRGNMFNGVVRRDGVELIALTADCPTDLGPAEVQGGNFNIKARPAADGIGLEEDAIVTYATFDNVLRVHLEGTGTVTLRGTVHDPLDELEVVSVVRGAYIEGDLIAANRKVGRIPADAFVPYFYARHGDDWSALDTERRAAAVVAG